MASLLSNEFLAELLAGNVDFDADTFKIILMASGFTYDRDNHGEYADVSANELGTAYGYTVGGAILSGVAVAQDDAANAGEVTWNNASWSISGGNITACGAIIYDDTHASDLIVGFIDFSGDQTCLDGGVATVANPTVLMKG